MAVVESREHVVSISIVIHQHYAANSAYRSISHRALTAAIHSNQIYSTLLCEETTYITTTQQDDYADIKNDKKQA
jgi:hypothetical protein